MLVEPERTAYDLRFRVLRFPVRVHPWFWIGTALMGSRVLDAGPEFFLAWIAVVFVALLVHELGHALAFRWYGSGAHIVLFAFYGLAIPTHEVFGRGRRITISLAGPFAGFLLCGLVYGSNAILGWAGDDAPPLVWYLYRALFLVNLLWGLMNLLPVFPLDGGHVSREVCGWFWGTRGKRVSLRLSFGCALLMVAYSLFCAMDARGAGAGFTTQLPWWFPPGTVFTAILFGYFAYQNYQELGRITWGDTHWDDRLPWER
ncbi:site-2 protease family protein [Gemmata sp. G18]|uniref:Site-2 protease family protein n=1 Tax=Gemmata palustris TaxID=2822762 RepID=A0ABS5BPY3_9BACT|nr:site-2 protease family protein [Gemmata palustris]MBP3955725.1 site-2 protease family protein [Gemmata palustris]